MKKTRNKVRIIAGSLRGRLISFPDHTGLRPTGDRIRETLFSWLQPSLPGSYCLDMFAGSGVLGIEAMSRGAECTLFYEKSASVCRELRSTCELFKLDNVSIQCADVTCAELSANPQISRLDVVFIDPPFDANLHEAAVQALNRCNLLTAGSLVVIESGKDQPLTCVPDHWELWREKLAGSVRLQLYKLN